MSGDPSVLRDQRIREVGARELRHQTATVIGSVRDGERLILTRHGQPQALVLSIDDGIELLIEPELAALADAAHRDYREGLVEALQPPGPYPVRLAQAAVAAYGRMNKQDRRRLRASLVRGRADERRLLWLQSRRWLVAFSYPDERFVLVHALFEAREVERALIGEEIWAARDRRALERRLHARDLAPR
jgi:prevent-host-death family protein